MRQRRAAQAQRASIYRGVWEITRSYWTAGGTPNRPEHVNWLAPLVFELPDGARVPDRMVVPLPPNTRPDFDAYRDRLGAFLGSDHRPARLDLLVMPDHVVITPDRLAPGCCPRWSLTTPPPGRCRSATPSMGTPTSGTRRRCSPICSSPG